VTPLPSTEETGSLGVRHLKRFWARTIANRQGMSDTGSDWDLDNTLLGGLRIGLRETFQEVVGPEPSFEAFEAWILTKNGGHIDAKRVEELNVALSGGQPACGGPFDAALTREEMAFWDENGYVIVHDAVSAENCQAAAAAIYEFLKMNPEVPETWYYGPQGHSIWIPLMHHPAIWANRDSPRIRAAFAQIWGRSDMWCTVDQAGMNPPERPGWAFPGPHLHWDVSVALPIPFGVQGILYLTDTAPDQGAFTCVPGFHRKIENWLHGLPSGADPRKQNLAALGAVPIAGRAGDLIIWHHALPHGSSPNRAKAPRVVQYIRMMPSQWDFNPTWK
jgi:ectoine hydroxylase-related dioxygenase (phytanoyl-CoA dioxygenase family)